MFKSKTYDRNEFITLGIVRMGSRNETETKELLRNNFVTFWTNVTNSLRIVPAVVANAIHDNKAVPTDYLAHAFNSGNNVGGNCQS